MSGRQVLGQRIQPLGDLSSGNTTSAVSKLVEVVVAITEEVVIGVCRAHSRKARSSLVDTSAAWSTWLVQALTRVRTSLGIAWYFHSGRSGCTRSRVRCARCLWING